MKNPQDNLLPTKKQLDWLKLICKELNLNFSQFNWIRTRLDAGKTICILLWG